MALTEGRGRLNIDASVIAKTNSTGGIDLGRLAYDAKIQAKNVQAKHFLPKQDLYAFSGNIKAKGVGTDFLSPSTRLAAKAQVSSVHYGKYKINNVLAIAHVAHGKVHADVDSKNQFLTGLVSLDALTNTKKVQATIKADVRQADLYLLQLVEKPMKAALCGYMDVNTDLKDFYNLQASVGDITLRTADKVYRPVDVLLDVFTRKDTTHAIVDCGDFHLNMDAHGGYKKLLGHIDGLQRELFSQMKNRKIDQIRLRQNFPLGHIYLSSGKNNFISRFIEYCGYQFKTIEMDLNASPIMGLNGFFHVDSMVVQGVQLDTIRALVHTKGDTIRYSARIENNKKNPQYVFRALVDGELQEKGSNIKAKLYDANNKLGLDVGLAALMQDNGIKVSLTDTHPILGYKKFKANADNYLMLSDDQRVSANLLLTASGGMGVRVYSNDENEDALQDITVSLSKFNLDKVLSVIPYMPDISGIMDGDFHVIQTKEEFSVSSNLKIDNLVYEKCPMGDVGSEFVYMPKSDGSHYVDGILTYEGEDVATVKGTYQSEGAGYLDATVGLDKIPLHFINGFVPDQLLGLKGYGEGELAVKGALNKPHVEGEVYLDSAYLISEPYGISMRFDDDPVRIVDSKLLFENFMMYANNESPLNLQGNLDFSNVDRMMLDLRMRAQNFLLIDAKENLRSEAFGKAYVNFFAMMKGPLTSLQMRGKLDVLGNTDMTYVLRESELSTDSQLDELVKFTDFKSGKEETIVRPAIEGFDMMLSMSIDESAHILCALNEEKTNYIDLMGGGDLQMKYNPVDNIRLTGKYTLNNGAMKYSLPIIPLKTFTIQDGSYLEFTGDPFNPILNITATENMKSTVNEGQGTGRSVDFVCGVKLTQTLSKPGIQFIISAPNDMTMQDELNTMSIEERGKIAVTMLASGMYLSGGNTSDFSMNSALSSFLNSEINNIAGSAMRSLGLDLGMSVDNSTNASGALHTDYNFKFAKRFFNNRLSFTIGGKVSSGAEMENAGNNDSFFNNVELQYRLNEGASQYIRAFYNNNTYDWLEGLVGEYGVGFMWRRKLQHFKDIFRFKTEKQDVPVENVRKDTIVRKKMEDSTSVKPRFFDPLREKL
uniref:translocation/assembly module TamB domain-containing protein n=1 Tax=Segatella hominis TaxID=2518605 RepID=UPI00403899D0